MLKLADGFAKPAWFFGSLAAYGVCFALLTHAFKLIPLSVAYAIWGGVGGMLIVALDIFLFGQSLSALQLACIGLIIAGVVGLKLAA